MRTASQLGGQAQLGAVTAMLRISVAGEGEHAGESVTDIIDYNRMTVGIVSNENVMSISVMLGIYVCFVLVKRSVCITSTIQTSN